MKCRYVLFPILFLTISFCTQSVFAQPTFEILIDTSADGTDPTIDLGHEVKVLTTEDRMILLDYENYRVLFYEKGPDFAGSQILAIVGEHSRPQSGQAYNPDSYNRLSWEFSGTIFNNQLWLSNYSFRELLVFDLDGNYITTSPHGFRLFGTSDTSLYAIEGGSVYRRTANSDSFAYIKELPDGVTANTERYGAHVKMGSNRLCVYNNDTLKVYSLLEYLFEEQADIIFSVEQENMPDFEVLPDKILWLRDYSGSYSYADLNGNNRRDSVFTRRAVNLYYNQDDTLYAVSTNDYNKLDRDLNEISYVSRDLYYWAGRFQGADDQYLYFYDFRDGGILWAPLNYDDGTFLVDNSNEIDYNGWNHDFRLYNNQAYLLSEWPPNSKNIFRFDITQQDSNMFAVDSIYGFDILNDSIFTMADTTLMIYSLDGDLLSSYPLQNLDQTNLQGLWRNSHVHLAVNQNFFFVLYEDTMNIFSKNGEFIQWMPYDVRSSSYGNTQLTADENYVFSNQELLALNLETGEVSAYVQGAGRGGYINGNRYWYESGNNIYTYQTIDVISGLFSGSQVVKDFSLEGAYPNPFNPITNIVYRLEKSMDITLSVYNILGQRVEILVDGRKAAGEHRVTWNASGYSSGLYFYVLRGEDREAVTRGILLR